VKDPEPYLHRQGVALACPVRRRQPARIEPVFRIYVNHEVYYVSDVAALRQFRRDPLRYCGLVTDPVSRQRFRPGATSPHLDYRGRRYYFQDGLNLRTFQALPESFAERKGA
jgi:YHS domain-containing protein